MPLLLPNVECLEEGGGKGRGHGSSQNDLQQLFQTLFTLTNIAALSNWHSQFTPALPRYGATFCNLHAITDKLTRH